jgi:hypothetical protein
LFTIFTMMNILTTDTILQMGYLKLMKICNHFQKMNAV